VKIFFATLLLLLMPLANAGAVYDVTQLGVPKFVNTNYIDVSKILALSKFRSSAGHDYSDNFEHCRSMKHYFMYPDATTMLTSPVTGTVTRIFDEWAGTQVQITSTMQPAFTFIIFHVALAKPLLLGDFVQEGQVLGTHIGTQTYSDIAVGVNTPTGYRLVSYFETLTDTGFTPFKARGIASAAQLIISTQERDAAPYQCSGQDFINLVTPADTEYVSLGGSAPPTVQNQISGPLNNQSISLYVYPPANTNFVIGGLFIGALLPASQGGALMLLSANGSWRRFTGCTTAQAYRLNQLIGGMAAIVIDAPTDLTGYKDVVLYAGYGIGSTWEMTCNNMLNNKTYSVAYILH
jgi:hypothetical protein